MAICVRAPTPHASHLNTGGAVAYICIHNLFKIFGERFTNKLSKSEKARLVTGENGTALILNRIVDMFTRSSGIRNQLHMFSGVYM